MKHEIEQRYTIIRRWTVEAEAGADPLTLIRETRAAWQEDKLPPDENETDVDWLCDGKTVPTLLETVPTVSDRAEAVIHG